MTDIKLKPGDLACWGYSDKTQPRHIDPRLSRAESLTLCLVLGPGPGNHPMLRDDDPQPTLEVQVLRRWIVGTAGTPGRWEEMPTLGMLKKLWLRMEVLEEWLIPYSEELLR